MGQWILTKTCEEHTNGGHCQHRRRWLRDRKHILLFDLHRGGLSAHTRWSILGRKSDFGLSAPLLCFASVQNPVKFAIGIIAVSAFATAFCIEAGQFIRLARIFLSIPPVSDAQLYFAMGRAWLNGFHFYRDLFETKPPGVFLLAALAMRLAGGMPLYASFQLVMLALVCPLLGFGVHTRLRSMGLITWIVIATGLLLGLTIAVKTLSLTAGFEAEGFGLLFAILATVLFAVPALGSRRVIVDVLVGTSLAAAALFKEPFVASGFLGILVFVRSRRDGYRVLRILAVAGLVGVAILILSGCFAEYVSLYLPEMFGGRATASIMYPDFGARLYFVIPAPSWVRTLNVYQFFTALAPATSAVLLSGFFGVCLCLWVPLWTKDLGPTAILVSTAMVVATIIAGHEFFVLYELGSGLQTIGRDVPWGNPIIVRLVAVVIVLPAALLVLPLVLPRGLRPPLRLIGLTVAAILWLLVAGMLVAWGNVSGQGLGEHLVFAFPPLAALAVYCLSEVATGEHRFLLGVLASLLVVNTLMPGRFDEKLASKVVNVAIRDRIQQRAAASLDALLSNCQESRYLVASPQLLALTAFTMHSPYQITYGAQRSLGGFDWTALETSPNPYLAAKLTQDLASTRIIVAAAGDDLANAEKTPHSLALSEPVLTMDPVPGTPASSIAFPIAQEMRDHFTTAAPACARDRLPIQGLQVFFRDF